MDKDGPITDQTEMTFRQYYGKLYASLLYSYGAAHIECIEDAIQNAFYKALKSWKPNQVPTNKEGWLYRTAKNDLLNQLKRKAKTASFESSLERPPLTPTEDARLGTLLLCAKLLNLKKVNALSITLFALKNVCGWSVKEIYHCTHIKTEAIYKAINRTKATLKSYNQEQLTQLFLSNNTPDDAAFVAEILYAIFNIGFDTLDEKYNAPIQEEVCLEAVALAKALLAKYNQVSTKHLLALFCFHLSRFPARYINQQFIPFFEQDRTLWHQSLLQLGFHYLEKPAQLNKYYLDALIVSQHMGTTSYEVAHWERIIASYDLLLTLTDAPIIRLNRAYCLYKADQIPAALSQLKSIAPDLPPDHIYYSLIMGEVLKTADPATFHLWFNKAIEDAKQSFRKAYIAGFLVKEPTNDP